MIDASSNNQFRKPRTSDQSPAKGATIGCVCVLLLASTACSNTTLDLFNPDLGLLAHWALDEGQPGSNAVDSSGFGNDGTPSTNPPIPTANVPPIHFGDPYSLSFNGQDQWIEMGNPALLNLGGQISLAAWVRPTALDNYRNVVAHGYRRTPDYNLALRIFSGAYQFTYWDGGADHLASAPVPASDVGAWVHLCGVFDGTTYYIYRNGALAASNADTPVPPANIDAIWAIGARAPQLSSAVDYLLQGQIDDVRIYGRALTPADVEALYRR